MTTTKRFDGLPETDLAMYSDGANGLPQVTLGYSVERVSAFLAETVAPLHARIAELRAENEKLSQNDARYSGLRKMAKESLLNPRGAQSEICPDLRTFWELPLIIASGPVGGFRDFDDTVDAVIASAEGGV